MLRYSIKLSEDNIKQEELVWREKYLSPDLSYISGVTSQDYHLDKFDKLAVSNNTSFNSNNVLPLETENVTRNGFVIIKDKEYDVISGETYDYSVDSAITYHCVFLNGKYYYLKDNKYTIDNWLSATTRYVEEVTNEITASTNDTTISSDTIAWIEDGKVVIDGVEYNYDFQLNRLRYPKNDNELIDPSGVTKCSNIECYPFSLSEYDDVTKFMLKKDARMQEDFEGISFVKYYYYIQYKNNYFTVSFSGDTNNFEVDIPNSLLGIDESGTSAFSIYYMDDTDTSASGDKILSGDTFDALRYNTSYAIIDDNVYYVNGDILNANNGTMIAVYLDNSISDITIGDSITIVDASMDEHDNVVYSAMVSSDGDFILFNNKKYYIEKNLCDKVNINGTEFDIDYINGKKDNVDCLVKYGNDNTVFRIKNNNTLEGYGLVVAPNGSAETATYPIESYSGVSIDGEKYIVESGADDTYYITLDRNNEYDFIIDDIKGSSMLICHPNINSTDFTQDFIYNVSREICNDVVDNQRYMSVFIKNKIFGSQEIDETLAFKATTTPTSSDDYYNLFDNLTIYTKNGYIHIPLSLTSQQSNNLMQDDIVTSKFFEAEKKKAINPIIDMEKDVYSPKYIKGDGNYIGSKTDFSMIESIRVNLHFRTRNLDNWKVNEWYNDISTSGTDDNWFVTDYYPYSGMTNKDILMNSSDLMGLLDFTNDDVYYQRSKIARSFLRFSYYDSPNPQTQTLLATSTVFMNGHRMFKRFIDNSRKDEHYFAKVSEDNNYNFTIVNKIAVDTEFINSKKAKDFSRIEIDDDHRIGSEFIITNKYESENSSEGYYIYIFREYSEKLVPKPIYMKIDFNHAGIGRTIPFIIPMKWKKKENDKSGKKFPDTVLTLNDTEILKKGIKLEDMNAQMYIPLYAVYDFKNKEYGYVFDDRYVSANPETNVASLNLFEIKFDDGSNVDELDIYGNNKNAEKVKYLTQNVAEIDINEHFKIDEAQCADN